MPVLVARVFDDWADRGRAEGMEQGHALAARHGFELLKLGAKESYLDIGCGNGYSVRWAAELSPSISAMGIDVASKMVARAAEQSRAISNARFSQETFPGKATEAAKPFDAIFSMEVFYYLPDPLAGIRSAFELLARGGRFVCILDHYLENSASHSWGPDLGLPLHLLGEGDWLAFLETAGFVDTHAERVRQPDVPGQSPGWEQIEGSLLLFGRKQH